MCCALGYGLELKTETKMLRVLHRANEQHPVEVVSNFCGAHSVPKGKSAAEAANDLIHTQIPAIAKLRDQGHISPEFIDVFMEKGVFEEKESRAILQAGQKAGFSINFHGDELSYTGSAELAAELGATTVSHLEWISEAGIQAMAAKKVVATLLPTTAYVLRIEPPPGRRLIAGNVPVALGSDFNPNAHCLSMPMVMNFACVTMKLTLNEALNAATINAAASLNRADRFGSLEVGKQGDFVVLGAPSWEHVVYQVADPPIEQVYVRGQQQFPV
jgi:imidazolonepropionase